MPTALAVALPKDWNSSALNAASITGKHCDSSASRCAANETPSASSCVGQPVAWPAPGALRQGGESAVDGVALRSEGEVLRFHFVEHRQLVASALDLRSDKRPQGLVLDPMVMVELILHELPVGARAGAALDASIPWARTAALRRAMSRRKAS